MARQRTQKLIAVRIDRTYISRPHPLRRLRRSAVFVCVAGAILFLAFATLGGNGQFIHNPGRLTFSHASFQNDCAKCHDGCDADGKPTNKFSLAVSDHACLKCHDAGVHNANQSTQVVLDKTRTPPELRSADCASCHVEHRGQSSLINSSDLQCLSCHSDLTGKTNKKPDVALHVVDFSLEGHPAFGRSLMKDGKLFDPTVLRFNHKKHLTDALKGEQRNCTFCHNPQPSAAETTTWEGSKSAFGIEGAPSTQPSPRAMADGSDRHRSLTQVNFEKNCGVCHTMGTLPGSDLAIPHGPISNVRRLILSYVTSPSMPWLKWVPVGNGTAKMTNDRIVAKLTDGMSDHAAVLNAVADAVKAAPLADSSNAEIGTLSAALLARLTTGIGKLPASLVPADQHPQMMMAVGAATQPSVLTPQLIDKLRDEVGRGVSGAAKTKLLKEFDSKFMQLDPPDPRLLQLAVFYASDEGNSCILCHDAGGEQFVAAVPTEWSSLAPPSVTLESAPNKLFSSAPTGIPAGPRQWFTGAEFNHDSHRSMNCVECHAAALTSEKTSDVLSPGIQWQGLAFKPGSRTEMVPATRSCVECHHPDNSDGPGAASNCTECHLYHDRSHEHPTTAEPDDVLNGKLVPSTQPAKLVAAAVGG
jgi:hypothetical protein